MKNDIYWKDAAQDISRETNADTGEITVQEMIDQIPLSYSHCHFI